jgi:hypothetical protein
MLVFARKPAPVAMAPAAGQGAQSGEPSPADQREKGQLDRERFFDAINGFFTIRTDPGPMGTESAMDG